MSMNRLTRGIAKGLGKTGAGHATLQAGAEYPGIKMKMLEQCCESIHPDTNG